MQYFLRKISVVLIFLIFVSCSIYAQTGNLEIVLTKVVPTFDDANNIVSIEKKEVLPIVTVPVGENISDDTILTKLFGRHFQSNEYFQVKITNNSGREWSVHLNNSSPDNSCVSVVPTEKFSQLKTEKIAPQTSVESGVLKVTGNGGEESFVLLAAPRAEKITSIFRSIDYLTGISRSNIAVRKEDLKNIDVGEMQQGVTKGKTNFSNKITITLGSVYSRSGQNLKSVDFYSAILQLGQCYRQNRQAGTESLDTIIVGWLNNRALANYLSGDLGKSKTDYETALGKLEELIQKDGKPHYSEKAIILTNLAQVYATLGEQKQAIEKYEQALKALDANSDEDFEVRQIRKAAIYNGLGTSNEYLENFDEAEKFYKLALKIEKDSGQKASEGITLNSLARIAIQRKDFATAENLFNQSLKLSTEAGNKSGIASAFNNLGLLYLKQNKFEAAKELFLNASAVLRQINNRTAHATILSNLMLVEEKLNHPQFAIFFGKKSVNTLQELRGEISGIETELQKSFLSSREEIYRNLAQMLITAGRISEAEQVLAMLKEEETFSYLRRDDKVAKNLLQTVSLTEKERDALTRYEQLADKITEIGNEFDELDAERKTFAAGQFPKQVRYDELKKQLADAKTTFQKFLDELKIKFGQKDERVVSVDSSLQNTLKRLNAKRTAVVSTIVGEKNLHIIVTTAGTQRAHTVDRTEAEINQMVADFRQALTSPINGTPFDPRPAGQKLYDVLIKPIEADLKGIDADTILWSLDGTLRYIPTAALWDKDKGYLAERFSNVVLTLASRDTLGLPVADKQNLNALGVGVSKETEGFSALTAVPDELDCIITDAAAKTVSAKPVCQNGVIEGKKLLDEDFTLTAFEDLVGRYPIIHIASHFSLNPGNDNDSFLLLGGGAEKRYTVENLRGVSLADVELLVLSACNTATPGGEKTNGVEIEGFGAAAQKQGAKSVLATLWAVADSSTRDLMVNFYGLYDKNYMSKAEAVRQAQTAMIYGKYKPADGNAKTRSGVRKTEGGANKNQIPFITDENARFAHPYYWSPFILIGNWR